MPKIKYLSVCSGMEAATVAWHHMGWTPVGFSEIEPFPSAILKHHYEKIPNFGDLNNYKQWPIERGSIDLLVSGTPCQAFSVAGLRKGLTDPRGNLALVFLGLADHLQPKYILWENVPGVLSSNGGRDFGSFIQGLAKLGYGFAWRICDAQYFGVPQRRKRLYLLGVRGAGNWRIAAEILFESKSLSGDLKESGKDGEDNSLNIKEGTNEESSGLMLFENRPTDGRITGPHNISPTMTSRFGTGGGNIPLVSHKSFTNIAPTIGVGAPYAKTGNERVESDALAVTFKANDPDDMSVRRLTPVECERLQGFPDNYSQIPWKGKPPEQCPDGPRYKACGNSMAVPCMRWIGERINNYIDKENI